MMKFRNLLIIAFIIISTNILSQNTIKGRILDQETKVPISNASVLIENSENASMGTVSNQFGDFEIYSPNNRIILRFSSVGYKDKYLSFNINGKDFETANILMEEEVYGLDEITINAGLKSDRDLAVSVSSLSAKSISEKIGDQPLPIVLQSIPGVFSIRNGGGSGDAELSIRGFKQENVSLLLNGIPINGEENGLVYWSNWLGLSSTAAEIQIQKGPGLANAGVSAIGGTVNIITHNSQKERSGSLGFSLSSYGNINTNITLNSGELNNGWSTSFMFSFGSGPGYVDATYVKSWSYFFTASKTINEKHSISISLLGAPQTHGQRTLKLSDEEVSLRGLKFNKDWGAFNGEKKNASENFYHKPFLSVNHEFKINQRSVLSNSVYASIGYGGGRWSESFNYAPSIFSYRDDASQIDWNAIYENNANHEQTYVLDNGEEVSGYSLNVQTNFLASHVQAGLMSNFEYKINSKLSVQTGIHYRYFNSFVREEIDDLLGGKFFIEDYGWSLAGVSGRNQIKTVGDIIRVDNNTIINFANIYAQLVYNGNKSTAYFSSNANSNWYQRVDRFNYISNTQSDIVLKPGFDIRGGYLFKPNSKNKIYINAAYISKAPYFKYVFGNFTNVIVKDLKNEIVKTLEIGYEFKWNLLTTKINAYYSSHENVSMLSNEYVQLENNSQTRAMVNGLNSSHKGIEFEISATLSPHINIGGFASIGDFKWQNNVSASLLNDKNVVVDTVNVYVKGLYIGGTSQNQLGIFADFRIFNNIYIKGEYLYFSKLYSDFDPTNRSDINDMSQAYQLPDYGLLNIYFGIPFKISNTYGQFQLNAYNVLNTTYIVNGEDGIDHKLQSFRGFWSFGRNISASIKINF